MFCRSRGVGGVNLKQSEVCSSLLRETEAALSHRTLNSAWHDTLETVPEEPALPWGMMGRSNRSFPEKFSVQ